ncbi:MAG: response regulator [bacterium]|nr:response regulator [bacterium]
MRRERDESPPPTVAAMAWRMHSSLSMSGTRVLIIDDDAATRKMLAEALREQGFDTRYAVNVEPALDLLDDEVFGAIVCAEEMATRDASELLEAAQRAEQAPPVIVMTDEATPDTAGAMRRAGAFGFVKKPFLPSQLCKLIHQAVSART